MSKSGPLESWKTKMTGPLSCRANGMAQPPGPRLWRVVNVLKGTLTPAECIEAKLSPLRVELRPGPASLRPLTSGQLCGSGALRSLHSQPGLTNPPHRRSWHVSSGHLHFNKQFECPQMPFKRKAAEMDQPE